MSTSVQLKALMARQIPSDGVYAVQVDIIDAVNIDFDVLVFSTEHDTFSHVASVYDLETYPVGKTTAAALGLDFYRGRGAVVNFATIKDATGFETVTKHRLKLLAVAWASIVDAFSGSEVVTVNSTT
jgi:hypothetical protein